MLNYIEKFTPWIIQEKYETQLNQANLELRHYLQCGQHLTKTLLSMSDRKCGLPAFRL